MKIYINLKKNFSTSFFIFFLFTNLPVSAQFIPEPQKTLYQIKAEKQPYFDSLRIAIGDSLFFREGSDYNEYMKFLLYWEPRLYPHGNFQIYFENNYQATQQIINEHPNFRGNGNSLLPNTTPWLELGPKRRPENGLNWIATGGCDRGVAPVVCLTFYKNNPDKMLCTSPNGGLFYSDDAGQTWSMGGSDLQWDYSGCRWALFHPNNPDIWYASNSGPYLTYLRGIYRTTDHGQTWNKIADYTSLNNNFWDNINKMVIDFTQPDDILYVAMTNGLFKTTNLSNPNPAFNLLTDPLVDGNIGDFEMKVNDHNFLVATVLDKGNPKHWHPVYSQDGGSTWNTIPNYPLLIDNVPPDGGVTIEITDANPDYFYFLIDDNSSNAQIYRYEHSSATWTNLSDPNGHLITYGGGHGFGISQTTVDEIYISQDIRYKTRIAGTWTNYPNYHPNVYEYHVDVEDMVAHPTNTNEVWMANHGGVYKSTNKGANWINMSEGIAIAEVFRLATSVTHPEYLLIGTFHDGTMRTDPPYNLPWAPLWRTVDVGDGLTCNIDYTDPKYMWASKHDIMHRSDDFGIEASFWNSSGFQHPPWAINCVLNTNNPIWMYSTQFTSYTNPARTEVSRSWNRGGQMHNISNFNTYFLMNEYLPWKIYSTPSNSDYLYAHVLDYVNGTNNPPDQRLFRTKTCNISSPASSWEELTMPRLAWISDLKVDDENPDLVYITYSSDDAMYPQGNEIIYRVDYSNSNTSPMITDLTKNLPYLGLGFTSLVLEKATDGGMYLATDAGVFYTNNKLLNDPSPAIGWNLVGVDLPHVGINGIELNYVANKLRVGTFGRGVWENDLYCPDDYILSETGIYSGNQFMEAENYITSNATINTGLKVRYRAGEEIILTDGFIASAGSDFKTFIHPCNHPGNSFRNTFQSQFIFSEEEEGNEATENLSLKLFPNPASSNVRFQFNNQVNHTIQSIKIKNLLGECVFTSEKNSVANNQIDISSLKAGIYFIEVEIPEHTFLDKLIKL